MFRRLYNLIGSAKVAQWLISAWLGLILVWVIPMQFFTGSAEWTKHVVYRTPPFLAVYALLALSTVACMTRRLSSIPQRIAWTKDSRPRGKVHRLDFAFDEARARRVLARCGFTRVSTHEAGASAVRNQLGPLGNVILHLAIVAALTGAGISALPGAMFVARARVTEGEYFRETSAEYVEAAHASVPATTSASAAFLVQRIEARGLRDLAPDSLRVVAAADGRLPSAFSAATPWLYGPSTTIAVEDFSYTPQLSLIPSGSVSPVAQLAPEMGRARSGVEEAAEARVANERYRVTIRLIADGETGTDTEPRFVAALAERAADGGWRLESQPATLTSGSVAKFGKMWLRVDGVRPNALLRVTRMPALPLVTLAVLLGAVGGVLRLVFPRTELSLRPEGDALAVTVSIDAYRDGSRLVLKLARAWREEEAA